MRKNKHPLIGKYEKECLERLREFIELNPEHKHTINNLTLRAGINRTKLTYGFKKIYETSIHQFIIAVRMERAKVMLGKTDKPIKAISKLNGYKDVKNFLTAFKKYTGQTPTEYQKGNHT